MSIRRSCRILQIVVLGLCGAWSGAGLAATFNFTGQLSHIDTNTGGGRYATVPLGQLFSGSFSYGSLADAATDPMFPGDYDFSSPPYGGFITDGSTTTAGSSGQTVQVTVDDNVQVDAALASLVNAILGVSLTSGDVLDIADIDTEQLLAGGGSILFGVSFLGLGGSTWSGLDLANFPALSGNFDHALFFISEYNAAGDLVYEGFGELASVTAVPVPPAFLLFATGLAGLFGCARLRRH